MAVQAANPFAAFLEGRRARQDEGYADTRNALARMELENAPAEMQRRNRLADLEVQGAERQYSQQQITQALQQTAAAASRLAQSDNPRAEARVYGDFMTNLRKQNPEIDQYNDDEFKQYMGWVAGEAQSKLGLAPAQPKTPEAFTLGAGQTRYNPDGKPIASAPTSIAMTPYQQERLKIEREKLNQPKQDSGPLVQVAGPDGNPVYETRDKAVGQPAYVARDKPAAADLKYQREIKSKQPRLKAARRRVDRLSEAILGADEVKDAQGKVVKPAVKGIAQNAVFDGGPLDQYALSWTKQGQEVAQSKAALLSELTALTRVPGIGSQSDLETRLASLPFPSAEFSPEVNQKAVAEIQAFVADLEDAYGSVEGEFQNAEVESLLNKYAPQ